MLPVCVTSAFRSKTAAAVDVCFGKLKALGVAVSEPRRYPEYHPEYYAIFFEDPDSIRLEEV
jgi:hypothetical protein